MGLPTRARRIAGVIAVNEPLAKWSRERLPSTGLVYPDFVCEPQAATVDKLLACAGSRVVVSRIFGPKKITPIYLPRWQPFGVGCQRTHLMSVGKWSATPAHYRPR